jgi:hypothetical protein
VEVLVVMSARLVTRDLSFKFNENDLRTLRHSRAQPQPQTAM